MKRGTDESQVATMTDIMALAFARLVHGVPDKEVNVAPAELNQLAMDISGYQISKAQMFNANSSLIQSRCLVITKKRWSGSDEPSTFKVLARCLVRAQKAALELHTEYIPTQSVQDESEVVTAASINQEEATAMPASEPTNQTVERKSLAEEMYDMLVDAMDAPKLRARVTELESAASHPHIDPELIAAAGETEKMIGKFVDFLNQEPVIKALILDKIGVDTVTIGRLRASLSKIAAGQ